MPEGLTVEFLSERVREALSGLPARVRASVKEALTEAGVGFENTFRAERLQGRPGLKRRSGNLTRSITRTLAADAQGNVALIVAIGGGDAPYAGVHERGGTITPRRARMLAIPVEHGLTAAGVSRFKSPRDVPGARLISSKDRSAAIIAQTPESRGKTRGKLRVFYVLKRSVTIPPRLGFEKTFEREAPGMAQKVQDAIDSATEDFNRA